MFAPTRFILLEPNDRECGYLVERLVTLKLNRLEAQAAYFCQHNTTKRWIRAERVDPNDPLT